MGRIVLICCCCFLGWGGWALGAPKLVTESAIESAVALKFETGAGRFYQIERKGKEGAWEEVGWALLGTGATQEAFFPAGVYRVVCPSGQWVKVWADEFAGEGLDLSKWGKEENNYGGGNNERQAYRMEEKYCEVKDGVLKVRVFRDEHTTSDGKKQPYSSARIRTMGRTGWTFGRFEVRAKMPSGQGIWPAVWMLPTSSKYGGWASGGEIDLLESRGSVVGETTGALHFGGAWPRNTHLAHHYSFPKKDAAEDFHVYGLEWSAEEIKWFVDGKLCQVRKRSEWHCETARDNPSAPFDQPFHLIMNVAVDGRFFEKTDQRADLLAADAFPQTMEVDYVRVYQWAE